MQIKMSDTVQKAILMAIVVIISGLTGNSIGTSSIREISPAIERMANLEKVHTDILQRLARMEAQQQYIADEIARIRNSLRENGARK